MTSTQIKYFMTLAECGSFTITADMHFITQPVVSKQIASLELELGLTLFMRSARKTSLTSAGKLLYNFFKEASANFEDVRLAAKTIQDAELGYIRIGITEMTGIPGVSESLNYIKRRYPTAQVDVVQRLLPFWPHEIRNGSFDVAITDFAVTEDFKELKFHRLLYEKEYLMYSKRHPLAGKPELCMRDFQNDLFYFIMSDFASNFPVYRFEQLCRRNGIGRLPRYLFSPSSKDIDEFIRDCQGVSIRKSPQSAEETKLFGFLDIGSSIMVGIAWRTQSANPLVREFVEKIISYND